MKTIGITGGSGAGKSTVTAVWARLGASVLDADVVYKEVLADVPELREELSARFGAIFQDGVLDRRKLADIVFHDEKALYDLNEITHKYVVDEMRNRLRAEREKGTAMCMMDAIYLLESELACLCQWTVAVACPTEKRIARVMERDGLDEKQAWQRIKNQKSDEYYFENCDIVIENSGDLDALARDAATLYERLEKEI